jgi:hypothetical protein
MYIRRAFIAKEMRPTQNQVRTARARRQRGRSILQVALAVMLLTVLALLTANICLIDLARNFNANVCVIAAHAGAQTAQQGGDQNQITEAVEQAIRQASPGGFFVHRPSLRELRFDSVHGLPYLVVATATAARVPAPLLVWNGTFGQDGKLLFYKTCIVSLRPAEKVTKP